MDGDDENFVLKIPEGEERSYLKIPEGAETWEEVIPVNSTFTMELNVKFSWEEIKSSDQLRFKLDKLFGRDVWFKDVNVASLEPTSYTK